MGLTFHSLSLSPSVPTLFRDSGHHRRVRGKKSTRRTTAVPFAKLARKLPLPPPIIELAPWRITMQTASFYSSIDGGRGQKIFASGKELSDSGLTIMESLPLTPSFTTIRLKKRDIRCGPARLHSALRNYHK